VAVGAGPPAVLLASPLVTARPYRPTALALAAHGFRVFTVELPGSGTADRLSSPWGVEEYAGWAAAALAALRVDDATVIGHSHAGGLAVALAALHPDRVGRVVLVGATGSCRQTLGRAVRGRAADTLAVEGRLVAREWAALAATAARHPRNFVRQVAVSLAADLTGYAATVKVPVLLAWGVRDHTVPVRCAEGYARHLPRAETYVSSAGSHAWLITHPAEFAAAVAGFAGRRVDRTR
jgi:pimeloyl-ACP methyl ester carboxylesterase